METFAYIVRGHAFTCVCVCANLCEDYNMMSEGQRKNFPQKYGWTTSMHTVPHITTEHITHPPPYATHSHSENGVVRHAPCAVQGGMVRRWSAAVYGTWFDVVWGWVSWHANLRWCSCVAFVYVHGACLYEPIHLRGVCSMIAGCNSPISDGIPRNERTGGER